MDTNKVKRSHRSSPVGLLVLALMLVSGTLLAAPTLFVSDSSGIRVYDDANGLFLGIFGDSAGALHKGIAFHPVTGNLFAGHNNGYIVEYDGETGALVGVFGDSAEHLVSAFDLKFHPVTGNLLVLEEGSNTPTDVLPVVQEYNGTTGMYISDFGDTEANLTRFAQQRMAFSPFTGNLLIADETDVKEFDGTTGGYIGSFGATAASTGTVEGIVFEPNEGNLFVADSTNDDVREFNGQTGAFVGSFDAGGNLIDPTAIAFRQAPDTVVPLPLRQGAAMLNHTDDPEPPENELHITVTDAEGNIQIIVVDLDKNTPRFHHGYNITAPAQAMVTREQSPGSELSVINNSQSGQVMDPVSTFTGELFEEPVTDLSLGGPLPLNFSRYYASNLGTDGNIRSSLGTNWLHNFDWRLTHYGNEITVITNRGRKVSFQRNGDNWDLVGSTDIPFQLAQVDQDTVFQDPRTNLMYLFTPQGKLWVIWDIRGNFQYLFYAPDGRLASVSDTLGRTLYLYYSTEFFAGGGPRKLFTVTDTDGSRFVDFFHTDTDLTAVVDVRGNTTSYSYDAGGLKTSETRPAGNTPYAQSWDEAGKVILQTDADGNTHSLTYDGLTTTITDPRGETSVHTHTATGEFSERVDESGASFNMGSDVTGRRDSLTDRLGALTGIEFHEPSGKVESVSNADGSTYNYSYSPRTPYGVTQFDLTSVSHADGSIESFTYDAFSNLTSDTDTLGNTSSATFNANGLPLTITNVAGGVTTNSYNADATLATTSDPAGNSTTVGYDDERRVNQITFADGSTRSFTRDNAQNLLTATDENGNTISFSYDVNNRLTDAEAPLLNTTSYAYDGNDRLISRTDPMGGIYRRSYNSIGAVAGETDANGNSVNFSYDNSGRPVSITDPGGSVWATSYDAEAIISSLTDPLSNRTDFTSDSMGRITRITSPLGNSSSINYDSMGRVISVTDALGNATTFMRDTRGLLLDISLPGNAISASYKRNALGNITDIIDPGANVWNRDYDNMARLTSRTDPLGNSFSFTYDDRNRLETVNSPDAMGTQTLGYDAAGNLISSNYTDNTAFNFTYDANNRPITANGITLGYDANDRITNSNGIAITRDPGGRITQVLLAPGRTIDYVYDANNRVTQVSDWIGGATSFNYDAAGRLTSMARPNGITSTNSYDNDNRLISLMEGELSSIALTRNANGQTTSATRNVPLSATARNLPDVANSVDAAAQLTAANYDAMGRRTSDDGKEFIWNLASQLTSFNVGGGTVSSTYDAAGNRLSRTQGGITHDYTWNYALGLTAISIEQKSGSDYRYYVHTPGGDLLYSIAAATNDRTFYHYDEMGNTLFLTDDSGTVTDSYAYTPYGRLISKTGESENPFTWQGEAGIMGEGNDFYYVRARYYDAINGRFISRDPVKSINPRKINPYQYALNNPLRYADPTGLDAVDLVFYDSTLGWATRFSVYVQGGHSFSNASDIEKVITQARKNGDEIRSVEIIGHGGVGQAYIGGAYATTPVPDFIFWDPEFENLIHFLRDNLADNAKLIFNECDVGSGTSGPRLLQRLADETGATVYAPTGEVSNSGFLANNPWQRYEDGFISKCPSTEPEATESPETAVPPPAPPTKDPTSKREAARKMLDLQKPGSQ